MYLHINACMASIGGHAKLAKLLLKGAIIPIITNLCCALQSQLKVIPKKGLEANEDFSRPQCPTHIAMKYHNKNIT